MVDVNFFNKFFLKLVYIEKKITLILTLLVCVLQEYVQVAGGTQQLFI